MNKKTIWTIVIIVILVAAGIVLLNLPKKAPPAEVPEGAPEEIVVPPGTPAAPELNLSQIKEPEAIVPGGSLVTREGEILTPGGAPVIQEEIIPGASGAPTQSKVLEKEELKELSDKAFEIKIGATGFVPNMFKVKKGQVVNLILTVTDEREHVLRFKDSSLRAVAISAGEGQSRAVTFKAPETPGIYEFVCTYHLDTEKGTMIVTE